MSDTDRKSILGVLRQRRHLREDDTSQDDDLMSMKPQRVFEECCGWYIGDPRWAKDIFRWLKAAGYVVTEESKPETKVESAQDVYDALDAMLKQAAEMEDAELGNSLAGFLFDAMCDMRCCDDFAGEIP